MTTAKFKQILLEVTARTLADMKRKRSIYPHRADLPFWPTPYDINCGRCEHWATDVESAVPEAVADWLEESDLIHCAVLFRGRWYDAECLGGVRDYHDLPLVRNRGLDRMTVLKRRGSARSNPPLRPRALTVRRP